MSQRSILRFADLSQNQPTPFKFEPDAALVKQVVGEMDLQALRKARLEGTLSASGRRDWIFKARLGATVVQPCVATLEPVTTRIEADLTRRFVHDFDLPETDEAEMPEDDTVEPLPTTLDLAEAFTEALALNLPLYPRKDTAVLDETNFTEPGKKPMTNEDARPFAGLAALKDQLGNDKPE